MKTRMYNKGHGWYIFASNWKDKEDKCYINVFFAKCEEPQGDDVTIDIQEARFGCYQGKAQLSVFKWESVKDESWTNKFGGDRADAAKSVDIEPSDLPFY